MCDVLVREGVRVAAEPTPATTTWRRLPRGKVIGAAERRRANEPTAQA